MKFTAGYWEIRPEVKMMYAEEVFDVQTDDESVTVYASTKHLDNRGDTLNLPTFTVRYTSPMSNVIRVQIVRHRGVRRTRSCVQAQCTIRKGTDS